MKLSLLRKPALQYLVHKYRPSSSAKTSLHTCIFKVDRFGDFILSLGAIRRVTDQYGETNCALVVSEMVEAFARKEFPDAKIIALNTYGGGIKESFRLHPGTVPLLDRYSFEQLVCLRHQRTLFHNLALTRIQSRHSYGAANETFGKTQGPPYEFKFQKRVPRPQVASGTLCLEQETHRALLEELFGCTVAPDEILPRLRSVQPVPGDNIVFTPFSSSPIRDYPPEQLVNVMARLRQQVAAPFDLCGGKLEEERLLKLQQLATAQGIPNVHVRVFNSFAEFASFVAAAGAVLTMDTSTAHLATALDKPALVILGGGHYGHFGPWHRSDKQVWVTNRLPCFGCDWKCIHPRPYCITEIHVETVVESFATVLSAARIH